MKHTLMTLYLFFFTGGTYAQPRKDTVVAEIDFTRRTTLPFTNLDRDTFYVTLHRSDTIRASLLITSGHMTMAHEKPGYVVFRTRDTIYLDDRRIILKAPVKVWLFLKAE